MNKEIQLTTDRKLSILKEHKLTWNIGDILVNVDYADFYKIHDIDEEGVMLDKKKYNEECWEERDDKYPKAGHYKWSETSKLVKIDKKSEETFEEFRQRMIIESFKHQDIDKIDEDVSDSTSLTKFDKQYYLSMKNDMLAKKEQFAVMRSMLAEKRDEMQTFVNHFETIVRRVNKIIGQIELYLGIQEDIVQIQSGQTSNAPITLRQQILYMDEEVGATGNQYQDENADDNESIDFTNIEEFDTWLLKNDNYKRMLPEEKGVVVFRVRRFNKKYNRDNTLLNSFQNQPNKWTYFLIRNGDNVYRILAQIVVHPRLFPKRKEFQQLMEELKNANSSWRKEEVGGAIFSYRQNLLLVKGLMDRTQIFAPVKQGVNIFDVKTWDGQVQYIHDEEDAILPDGRLSFKEWQKNINSKLKRGSRVYFNGFPYGYLEEDYKDYTSFDYTRFAVNPHGARPKEGVYSVELTQEVCMGFYSKNKTKTALCCFFMQDDEVYHGWTGESSERKHRTKFYLYHDDDFILNYDLMTFEDVDFYIQSRIERAQYVKILPILRRIRKLRLEELAWEKGFVDSMSLKLKVSANKVWEAIDWWKNKVIWKRPLTKDDAKAWRMIEKKVMNDEQ